MCGISGIIKNTQQLVTTAELSELSSMMHHRGPDHLGSFIDGSTGFSHNRLSIIDLSNAANQPFEDNEHVLIYNGEIYNFNELRSYTPGITYQTHSDTEVLFHLLKIQGVEKTVTLIEGMFAFAWYSKTTKQTTLVRDRLGIKPLYYHVDTQGFYFASEIKALWNALPIKLNNNRVLDSFYGGAENHTYTNCFDKVYSLKPGHLMEVSQQQIGEQKCYFSLLDSFNPEIYHQNKTRKRKQFQEEFNALINQSVKGMMVTDASIATMASGGVDSSVITYFASQYKPVDIYTSDVVGYNSELDDVTLLSEKLGLPLHISTYENKDYLKYLTHTTWHQETPVISFSNSVPFGLTTGLAQNNNVKVVLTGEGSDELFLGYPKLHFERIMRKLAIPYNLVSSLYNKIPGISKYLHQLDPSGKDILIHLVNRNFDRQQSRDAFHKKFKLRNNQESDYLFSSLNLMSEHLVGLLHRNDRMGMMHSIEARFPFLNEKLVHFGLHVPYQYKYEYFTQFYNKKHPFMLEKSLVRKSVLGKLPNSLVYKTKWGFGQNAPSQVQYKPGAFAGGYLTEALDLDAAAEKHLVENYSPYLLSKLFAMEVFGRIYGLRNSLEETNDWVQRVAYF